MKNPEKLLDLLAQDARLTPAQLAAMLGETEEDVAAAINAYEKNSTILGYKTVVDWDKTSKESVTALIEVKITPQKGMGFDEIARQIYSHHQVESVYLMSGGFDLTVIIKGRTMREVARFVSEQLGAQIQWDQDTFTAAITAPREIVPEPEPEPAPAAKYTADQGDAANEIDSDGTYDGMTYTSTKANENALRVSMAYISAKGDTITKSGDVDDVTNSDLYGKNAALLVTHGGHGAFSDTKISTTGNGAAGAYGYSKGTYINLTDSTVDTTGNFAPAAEAAEKAMMKLANTTASTTGYGSPAIKVSKNGGIILAENSHFTTTGQESHGVYTTGDVTLTGSTVNAQATKAAVIKNNDTLSLENSTLEGNETNSVPYNIVLYSDENAIGTMGTQQFNAKDSTIISHKGGMFLVTSTHGRVTLENTTIQQDPALPVFTVTGNDGSLGWGDPGSNGGHMQLVLVKQELTGNILVDSISDVNMNITDSSTWNGAIHIVPNAQNGAAYHTNADIFIAAGSTWNLTEDSEVTTVTNLGTINYNGHTIKLADGTVMKG